MSGGRSHVPKYILPEDSCIPKTSFREAMYPKYILSRSYVPQVHIFIISPVLHTSMQFTWDVIIKISIVDFKTYSKHIPQRSYVPKYILSRIHVLQVHPSEELCTPSTSFRGVMYPKQILPRSYVLLGCTLIISPALHTRMHFTWDDIIKFNHRF